MNDPQPPVELSAEMLEAIRILKEDGQIASFNKMTESHQAMITRLDEVENNWSEFRASQKEEIPEPTPEPQNGGTPSGNPPGMLPDNPTPEPPPEVEPPAEPIKKGRKAWWEGDTYSRD